MQNVSLQVPREGVHICTHPANDLEREGVLWGFCIKSEAVADLMQAVNYSHMCLRREE